MGILTSPVGTRGRMRLCPKAVYINKVDVAGLLYLQTHTMKIRVVTSYMYLALKAYSAFILPGLSVQLNTVEIHLLHSRIEL